MTYRYTFYIWHKKFAMVPYNNCSNYFLRLKWVWLYGSVRKSYHTGRKIWCLKPKGSLTRSLIDHISGQHIWDPMTCCFTCCYCQVVLYSLFCLSNSIRACMNVALLLNIPCNCSLFYCLLLKFWNFVFLKSRVNTLCY